MTLTKNEAGYWEVRVKGPDGKYKSRSTGRREKGQALDFIRDARIKELETAAQLGVLSQEVASILITGSNPVTVEGAIPLWREHMEYRHLSARSIANAIIWVKAWAAWARVETKPVAALKVEDFDGWINGEQCSNKLGSRKVMLSALRSFCGFCHDSGWMPGNPPNLIQVDMSLLLHAQKETTKKPCFTEEEMQELIEGTSPGSDCADYFWNAAIIIGRYTGLRLGDICCLEWDSIDLAAGTLSVWTQKRDRRVELPLQPEILRFTVSLLQKEHPKFVFPSQRNLNNDVGCRCTLSIQFSRLMRDLGILPGKSFHCLRSNYVEDCVSNGMPMEHISRNVGHSNTKTTEGYRRPSPV
jgi:integrase